jgi:hypothetical protein
MVFGLFGFKKKPVIEDVVAKVLPPEPAPMSFDEALAAQAAAKAAAASAEASTAMASSPTPTPTPSTPPPQTPTEDASQMGSMKATREDVIAAYKIFLGRLPESMEVVDPRVGGTTSALLVSFLSSKEFLDQAPKSQLVLALAKKILEDRQKDEANKPSQ